MWRVKKKESDRSESNSRVEISSQQFCRRPSGLSRLWWLNRAKRRLCLCLFSIIKNTQQQQQQ